MNLKHIYSGFVCLLLSAGIYAQEKPQVELGGALRFNYKLASWKDGQKKRGGDFGYDVFIINPRVQYKGLKLDAQYRLYSSDNGGGLLKYGHIGYDLNEKDELQLGLMLVPFGITVNNSHGFYTSLNFPLGLEEDYDMGVKFTHKGEKWDYSLAFFKNAEELNFGSNSDISYSRFSYDVSSIDIDDDGKMEYRNKEVNQLNGTVGYNFETDKIKHRVGVSGQYGGLYNLDTEKTGSHYALAAHYELKVGDFDVLAQVTTYKYKPEAPDGERRDVIAKAANGGAHLMAAQANTYTLGLGYNIPVKWGPVSNILVYNDFGYIDKRNKDFDDTIANATGALITIGNIQVFADFVTGKNHSWIGGGPNALANGNNKAKWEALFNLNIGYYF